MDAGDVFKDLSFQIESVLEYIDINDSVSIMEYATNNNIDLFLVLKREYVEIRQLSFSSSKFLRCFFDSAKDLLLSLEDQAFDLHELNGVDDEIDQMNFHVEVEKRRY